MKIAHTADLHISEQEHLAILRMIVDAANALGCEHLLIAGDLFDSDDAVKVFSRAACSELDRFKGSTWLIPGNHDPLSGTHCYFERGKVFKTLENVRIGERVVLTGIPYMKNKGLFDLIVERAFEKQPDTWIILAHGTLRAGSGRLTGDSHFPVMIDDLKKLGCSFAAMGHYHLPVLERTDGLLIINPGSPRVTRISDTGRRKFIVFDTETRLVDDAYLDVPYNHYVEVHVDFRMKHEEIKELACIEAKKAEAACGEHAGLATFVIGILGTVSMGPKELEALPRSLASDCSKAVRRMEIDLGGLKNIDEEVLHDSTVSEILEAVRSSDFKDKEEIEDFTVRLLSELYAGRL